MTEGLAEKLKALREKATPGPWDLRSYQSGSVNVVMREWPAPNEYGQGALFASMTAFNIGEQDANEIGREKFYNADLIRTLVNNLDTIISALSGDGMGWLPIETAPKDGKEYLLFDASVERWKVSVGQWVQRGFWGQWEDLHGGSITPSHWMPLPASPALTNDKEKRIVGGFRVIPAHPVEEGPPTIAYCNAPALTNDKEG